MGQKQLNYTSVQRELKSTVVLWESRYSGSPGFICIVIYQDVTSMAQLAAEVVEFSG